MNLLLPSWPTYHDLTKAYQSCRLRKRPGKSQAQFESRLGINLVRLHEEIHSGDYYPSPSHCFVVSHPKPREIFAADFRDRVVHHLIVGVLEPLWEKKFIYSSFACRRNKGPYAALDYAKKQVRQLSKGGLEPVWALKLDISKFFVTIDRKILEQIILKWSPPHPLFRSLIQTVYSHDARSSLKKKPKSRAGHIPFLKNSWFHQEPHQGIPIGNLSSQLGANIYLSELDHFVQRTLKPKSYLRYVDDLLVLGNDPADLEKLIAPIDHWLRTCRKQELNQSKTKLVNLYDGIEYLGYELLQTDDPAEPLQLFSQPKKKFDFVLDLIDLENTPHSWHKRPHPLAAFLPNPSIIRKLNTINSKLGGLHHSRSHRFKREALERVVKTTTEPRNIPCEFCDPLVPYKIKEGYRSIKPRL